MNETDLSPELLKLFDLSKSWLQKRWNGNTLDIQIEPPLNLQDDGFVLAVKSHAINFRVRYYAKIVPFDIYTILVYNLLKQFSCGPEHFLFVAIKNATGQAKWSMGIVTAQVAGLKNEVKLEYPIEDFSLRRKLLLKDAFLMAFFSTMCKLDDVPLTADRWGLLIPSQSRQSSAPTHQLRILDFSHGRNRQKGSSARENFMHLWHSALLTITDSTSADLDNPQIAFDTVQLRRDFKWLANERSVVSILEQACDDTLAWTNPNTRPDTRTSSSGFVSRLLSKIRPFSTLQSDVKEGSDRSDGEEETKHERQEEGKEDRNNESRSPDKKSAESFDAFHEAQIQLLEEFRSRDGAIRTEIRRFFAWFDAE